MDSGNNSSLYSLKTEKEDSIKIDNDSPYKLKINYNKGESEEIKITKDSNPEKLAYDFCHKNNLDYEFLKSLTEKIKSIKDSPLLNYKYSFSYKTNTINSNDRYKLKNSFLTEEIKDIKKNNELNKDNSNFKELINKEISRDNIKENNKYNSISNYKENKSLVCNTLTKNENNKMIKNNFLSNKVNNNYKLNNNKNKFLTTNVINQTIQKCLEIVENETKPFNEENNNILMKDTKSSKFMDKTNKGIISGIKCGSFLSCNEYNNSSNNSNSSSNIINNISKIKFNKSKISNDNKNISLNSIKDNQEINKFNNENNNDNIYIDDKNLINKESFITNINNNNISNNVSNNLLYNDIQAIIKDIDINISKTESENTIKNIISKKNNNSDNKKDNNIKNDINKKFVICEAININLPSCINKEININILSSQKLSSFNKPKSDEKFKKGISRSNRCIPKSKNNIKSNRSESNLNNNKTILELFNEAYNRISKEVSNKNNCSLPFNNNLKSIKNKNNRDTVYTQSTYIKSCKNSLSSLTVSDKNLITYKKNDFLNKLNNESKLDEYSHNYNNSSSNTLSSKNKYLDKKKLSQKMRNINSLSLSDNIIFEELDNNTSNIKKLYINNLKKRTYTYNKENDYFKSKNLLKKYKNIKFNKLNYYDIKFSEIKKYKDNKVSKKNLLLDNNNKCKSISDNYNDSSIYNKYKNNSFNKNNSLTNNCCSSRSNYKSINISNNNINNFYYKPNCLISQTTRNKVQNSKYVKLTTLTNNIISKIEIEKCFKNIFYYITKNKEVIDVFYSLNTKNIPFKIFNPVKYVIKNCNKKKRFISANEFVRKGYELFNFLPQNDKISIINFNVVP